MRRLSRRRPLRIAGAAAAMASLALLATSCGVPIQSTATRLPSGVAASQPSSSTTTTAPYKTTIKIWWMVTYAHVAVYSPQVPKATLTAAIQVLLTGPSQLQMDSGYQTALGTVTLVRAVSVASHMATVDFTRKFGNIAGTFGALAVAQVVFTIATNATTVAEVQFQINGRDVGVPLPSGAVANGPVQPARYETLKTSGPVPTTTTTTTTPPTSTTAPAASGATSGSASG